MPLFPHLQQLIQPTYQLVTLQKGWREHRLYRTLIKRVAMSTANIPNATDSEDGARLA
jgi:hypothetical protein